MGLLQRLTAELLREPRGGYTVWISIGFGIVLIVLSAAEAILGDAQRSALGVGPRFVLLGSAFVLMGGAELLPADRRRVAGFLRFVTVGVFLAWLVALLLTW